MATKYRSSNNKNYDQNDGVPGVVYILENTALAKNLYKIGQTRYSGRKRAESLNNDAATGMPAEYRCIFERKTVDCGNAEKLIFAELQQYRRGKWGQEFFELDPQNFEKTKRVIHAVCDKIDGVSDLKQEDNQSAKQNDSIDKSKSVDWEPIYVPNDPTPYTAPSTASKSEAGYGWYIVIGLVVFAFWVNRDGNDRREYAGSQYSKSSPAKVNQSASTPRAPDLTWQPQVQYKPAETAFKIVPTELPKKPVKPPQNKVLIKTIQNKLNRLGYDSGVADGHLGERTAAAIIRFQNDHGLTPTGQESEALLASIDSALNEYRKHSDPYQPSSGVESYPTEEHNPPAQIIDKGSPHENIQESDSADNSNNPECEALIAKMESARQAMSGNSYTSNLDHIAVYNTAREEYVRFCGN